MEFKVLGPLEAYDDAGNRIDLGTAKQRALLALLLIEPGQVVSVDTLVDRLWAADPPDSAIATLRVYASNLRRALEPDRKARAEATVLVTAGPGYMLKSDRTDAATFEQLVAAARSARTNNDPKRAAELLDEANALWRGHAYADVAPDVAAVQAEAARLEEQRQSALEDRLQIDIDLGRHSAVISKLGKLIQAHPLRERLRVLLVEALVAAGRRTEARHALEQAKEHLLEELGLEPGPLLRAAEAALDEQPQSTASVAPAPGPAPSPAPTLVTTNAPLVGRDDEMAMLRSVAGDLALAGHGRPVLIAGEPGAGKTRLAEELVTLVPDGLAALGRSLPDEEMPAFWPWLQVLRTVVEAVAPDELDDVLDRRTAPVAQLLPELARTSDADTTALVPDAARFVLFDAVTTLVTRLSERRPILITLDDLQWADAASMQLLRFAVDELGDHRVLLVVTVREEDLAAPGVADAVSDISRHPRSVRLDLGPLDGGSATAMAVALLGEDRHADLAATLAARADGNPFFITELVRLHRQDPDQDIPSSVKEVVRRRLQQLPEPLTDLLTTAAVVGREVDVNVLERLPNPPPDVLALLEEATRHGLLAEDEAGPIGRYRFTHGLVRDALQANLTGLRRARLHADVARTLESMPARDEAGRLAELAHHWAAAAPLGFGNQAADAAMAAGEGADRRLGYEEAEVHYGRAIEAIAAGARVDPARHARLLVGLARARRAQGDSATSRARCLEAAELALASDDPSALAEAALGLGIPGAVVGMDFGVVDEPRVQLLEEALRRLPQEDTPLRLRLLVHLVLALYLAKQPDRRAAALEEAKGIAARLGEPIWEAVGLAAEHSVLWGLGTSAERVVVARRMVETAEQGGAAQTALEARIALAVDLLESGDIEGFDRERSYLEEYARRLRQPYYRWYPLALAATKEALVGRYDAGEVFVDEAQGVGREAFGRRGDWGIAAWHYVTAWDRGTLPALQPVVAGLASTFPEMGIVRCALAHIALESGAADDAAETAAELLDDPEAVERDALWPFGAMLLGEVLFAAGDNTRAQALLDEVAGGTGQLVVIGSGDACCGSFDRTLGLLAATAGRTDEAEQRLRASIEIHDRIGAEPWSARSRADLARVLRAAGRSADADELEAAAATIADRLGAPGVLGRR